MAQQQRNYVVDRLSGKIGKGEANYRPAQEAGNKSSCAECEHYEFPGQESSTCKIVAGQVEAMDLCDRFLARVADQVQHQAGINVSITVEK